MKKVLFLSEIRTLLFDFYSVCIVLYAAIKQKEGPVLRKFSEGSHTGERRELRKNGNIYTYERITAYNPQTKKTYTVSQKLKEKNKAGT